MTAIADPILSLIAAVAENDVIGSNNTLPWQLSSDLKRFKAVTMGKPVIMGRKTYLSIGKPLEGRNLIVLTRDQAFSAEGVEVVHTLDEAIAKAEVHARKAQVAEIMVAGGADIYAQTIQDADRLYLTRVHAEPEGDARFPKWTKTEWELIHSEDLRQSSRDSVATTYEVYDRI